MNPNAQTVLADPLEIALAENIWARWKQEDSMTEFEIRILSPDGRPSLITTLGLFSIQSAIGSALRLARGRPFEVWGDGQCLYASIAPQSPPPSDRPAA